jgi:hypothetical protein
MKITQPKEVQLALRKLEQDILSLQNEEKPLSLEEIQKLYQKISEAKSSLEGESGWFAKFFGDLSFFGDLRRVAKMERALQKLLEDTKREHKRSLINRKIWELKRKDFFAFGEKEEIIALLKSRQLELQAIRSSHAFAFTQSQEDEANGHLFIYALETDSVFMHPIIFAENYIVQNGEETHQFETPEEVLTFFVPKAIPLFQLQEIGNLLKNHATADSSLISLFSMKEIEEKLSALLKNYPQGAYILHPSKEDEKNALMLSRIHQQGKIDHLKIDLGKNLGQYTILNEKQTRLQFKRKLEQMGVPLQLRVQGRVQGHVQGCVQET